MMTKKYLVFFIMLSLIPFGCKKFVDVGLPKNLLVTASVFQNDGQAIAAMTNIYGTFTSTRAMGFHVPFYLGIAGDELTASSTTGVALQFYQNAPRPINSSSNGLWEVLYTTVYQANGVLEGCEQSELLSKEVKKQVMAEAKFMRAFAYFYLVNLWGDVPLVLTTNYRVSGQMSRTAISDVYKQIIADLENAAVELNTGYVDGSSKATYSERVRPNQASAKALLARVYLYTNNWIKAEENASTLISNSTQYDLANLNGAFLKNNKEAIWQLMQSNTGTNWNTFEGSSFILIAKPLGNSSLQSSLSPQLLAAFTATDLRRVNWVGSYVDKTVTPNVTYYFPYKYKERTGATYLEYSTVLRLAEQYLIRAEARTELNDISGAKEDLNKLRARTGLGDVPANTQTELRAAILKERQLELFTEWGHRWMDLKRTGNIDAVMQSVTPAKGGAAWSSYLQLFPIPQKDLEANQNLKQNPGYN